MDVLENCFVDGIDRLWIRVRREEKEALWKTPDNLVYRSPRMFLIDPTTFILPVVS